MEKNIIEITADVKLPGTDTILEKGDKIQIVKEMDSTDSLANDLHTVISEYMEYNDMRGSEAKVDFDIAVKKVKRWM